MPTGIDIINNNMVVNGQLSATRIILPAGTVDNNATAAGAASNYIQASKLEGAHKFTVGQSTADAIQVATYYGPIITGVRASSISFSVFVDTLASSSTNEVIVDLQRSTAAGAFASILSAAITIESTGPAKTATAGSITTTTGIAGDAFRIVLTTSGSTSTQAKGFAATFTWREDPA